MAKILDQGKFLYTVQEFVRSKGLFEKTVMTELLSIGQELRIKIMKVKVKKGSDLQGHFPYISCL